MNRKQTQRGIRKLWRQGQSSLAITLPIELVAQLKWHNGQKVKAIRHRGGILIKDWKK